MSLSFYSGGNQPRVPTVVLIGAARSGKTIIGNLLGSCQHVEHIDQPWLLEMLPIMAGEGILSETLAIQMFQTYEYELWNDRILMRHVNFRPADLSSIWRQKTPQEIFTRLIGLYSRDDVRRYVRERCPTLVLTFTDALPFCDFFWKALPGCKLLHIVREGLEVALEVEQKRWLSDEELRHPLHPNLYRTYANVSAIYHLPYWVERGLEKRFLVASEYARALWYWRRLMEMADTATKNRPDTQELRIVKLSDVLDRPRETISSLIEFVGVTQTEVTEGLLARIKHREKKVVPERVLDNVAREELIAMRKIYQELDLPNQNIDMVLCGKVS